MPTLNIEPPPRNLIMDENLPTIYLYLLDQQVTATDVSLLWDTTYVYSSY